MDYLVWCICGHSIDHHDDGGCEGERLRGCTCRRTRATALDAAIRAARTIPVTRHADQLPAGPGHTPS